MRTAILWTVAIVVSIVVIVAVYLLMATWPHCATWATIRQETPAYREYSWNPLTQRMSLVDHPVQTAISWDYCTVPIGGVP